MKWLRGGLGDILVKLGNVIYGDNTKWIYGDNTKWLRDGLRDILLKLGCVIYGDNTRWLRGGLGDILLKLGNIRADESYIVFSHSKQAIDLVREYTTNFKFIEMKAPIGHVPNEVDYSTYPKILIPERSIQKAKSIIPTDKKIIGIHPIGSKISREYDSRKKRPQKLMSHKFINFLLVSLGSDDVDFFLFCAPNEVDHYEDLNLKIVAEPYIWDCLAAVSLCDLVIATDSAIKTFSAVQHIPTIVVMSDHEEEARNKFIDPYKEITPIRFIEMDDVADEVILTARKLL